MTRLVSQRMPLSLDGNDWWAIFDATDATVVPLHLKEEKLEHVSLWKGSTQERYWDLAPYLARMDHNLLDWLRDREWNRPWGILLRSPAPMKKLQEHFRKLVMVRDRSGEQVIFRFYDPRVMTAFLPSCNEQQLKEMFGPVQEFWAKIQKEDDFRTFSLTE